MTSFRTIWGGARGVITRTRKLAWVDFLVVFAIVGLFYGLLKFVGEVRKPEEADAIDLSLWSLPRYTFYSLLRGIVAYILSLLFTLTYGYWAADDVRAQRVLVPLLDIFQSIPL